MGVGDVRSMFFLQRDKADPTLCASIFFPSDDARLDEEARKALNHLVTWFKGILVTKRVMFTISGNTDFTHTDNYNLDLSTRRGQAVRTYLALSLAKEANYLGAIVVALGESKAFQNTKNEEKKYFDRRVDIYEGSTPAPTKVTPQVKRANRLPVPRVIKRTFWRIETENTAHVDPAQDEGRAMVQNAFKLVTGEASKFTTQWGDEQQPTTKPYPPWYKIARVEIRTTYKYYTKGLFAAVFDYSAEITYTWTDHPMENYIQVLTIDERDGLATEEKEKFVKRIDAEMSDILTPALPAR